jgi:hypothetical protein
MALKHSLNIQRISFADSRQYKEGALVHSLNQGKNLAIEIILAILEATNSQGLNAPFQGGGLYKAGGLVYWLLSLMARETVFVEMPIVAAISLMLRPWACIRPAVMVRCLALSR